MMFVKYTRGCAVFTTIGGYREYSGGYHGYTGGCSVHQRDITRTMGDTMINVGKVIEKATEFVRNPRCNEHAPEY